MNSENTSKIINACPSIFSHIEDELNNMEKGKPFLPIAFYFECGDGWCDLLVDLCMKIQIHLFSMSENDAKQIKVDQVKEKYGTLRFYMNSYDEKIESYIREAEIRSANTCEVCGAFGEVRGDGWLYCSCENHVR